MHWYVYAHAIKSSNLHVLLIYTARPVSFNSKGNEPGVPKLIGGTRDLEPDWNFNKTW
jgi:hypothetical protein